MARYLSPEWIDELDAAMSASAPVRAATAEVALVVEHRIGDGPDGSVTYHVAVDRGTVRVRSGPAPEPTVTFTQSWADATDIGRGRVGAQAAFLAGRLRLGGDTGALLEHQAALAGLDEAVAEVWSRTEF